MKKAIIVHGWGGTPNDDWYSWLKGELEKKGWEVKLPEMPDTENPKIGGWVSKLQELDCENCYFVGHSIGCQAILRYLEKGSPVKGCVFVAGWFNLTEAAYEEEEGDREIAEPWIETPIDFKKVKEKCNKFVDIASDNDPYVPLSSSETFKEKLGAEVIIEKGKGHFGIEDGVTELPIVLEKLGGM